MNVYFMWLFSLVSEQQVTWECLASSQMVGRRIIMLTSIISGKKNPLALLRMLFIEDGIPVDNLSFIHILFISLVLFTYCIRSIQQYFINMFSVSLIQKSTFSLYRGMSCNWTFLFSSFLAFLIPFCPYHKNKDNLSFSFFPSPKNTQILKSNTRGLHQCLKTFLVALEDSIW